MVETYKNIVGFENYSVSDLGNVINDKTGRMFKGNDNGDGYLQLALMKNKSRHNKKIHQLVAAAFLLNPENKHCVDHIDNDRQNNNIINLRFSTLSQNNQNRSLSSKCHGVRPWTLQAGDGSGLEGAPGRLRLRDPPPPTDPPTPD